jgi:predicted nucleic acid-binding protein
VQITAVKFKATCLKLIDRVAASDRIIVATARRLGASLVTADTAILGFARATRGVRVLEL